MPRRALLISQVYPSDPAAVGQHFADLASLLVQRGWEVTVLTADRGYDDPSHRFPAQEWRDGVNIRRLPWSSLGKRTILHRVAGMVSFLLQATSRALLGRRVDVLLVSTSPPLAGAVGWFVGGLRRIPYLYWIMDLNPDQAVALGKVRAEAWTVRLFNAVQRRVLRSAGSVVALDPFMATRLLAKVPDLAPPLIVPPWASEENLEPVAHADNPFRQSEGLEGKFVVMYSGNHSVAHPLETFIEAATLLRQREDIVFYFIGGGVAKRGVELAVAERNLPNVRCRGYLPLNEIRYSLSAADLHLVSMGPAMVGCVHPCKAYGALALHRPLLVAGPADSHVGDMLAATGAGWRVDHGDAASAAALIGRLAEDPARAEATAHGESGHQAYLRLYQADRLRAQVADAIERLAARP